MFANNLKVPTHLNYTIIKIISVPLVLLLSYLPGNYNTQNLLANFHYPDSQISWLNAFTAWDARFYWYLAEQSSRGDLTAAFYPLYPQLIRLFSFIMPTPLAGMLISNICLVLFAVYSFRLGKIYFTEETARAGLIAFLLFPTSFFCNLMYSESLFLMLSAAGFYYLEKEKFLPLLLCALLMVLTRPVGICIAPALAILLIQRKYSFTFLTKIALVVLPIMLFGLYHLSFITEGKSADTAFVAQQFFVSNAKLENLLNPFTWLSNNFVSIKYSWQGFTDNINDRIAFIFAVFFIIKLYKKVPAALFLFTSMVLLVPALSGPLMSYQRYLLCGFPLFWVVGEALTEWSRQPGFIKRISVKMIFFAALILQCYYLYRYANNNWVG